MVRTELNINWTKKLNRLSLALRREPFLKSSQGRSGSPSLSQYVGWE